MDQRMDSLSETVDVGTGVNAHAATHSAAVLDTGIGGICVEANLDGDERLVALAECYGAGVTHHLAKTDELVIELDQLEHASR